MQVYVLCVDFKIEGKILRMRRKKEYWQKCYSIFHRFWDLNVWFGIKKHAKSEIWHDEERTKDGKHGKLRHPTDSLAWGISW